MTAASLGVDGNNDDNILIALFFFFFTVVNMARKLDQSAIVDANT